MTRKTHMTHTTETPATTTPRGSWLVDRPLRGPALPSGRLARLWGWLLLTNRAEQLEVVEAASLGPRDRVLEVGCGPGVLLRLATSTGAIVTGVDPSPEMVRMAGRRAGGADVRVGTAEDTGLPDAACDVAISVNNVPMWSDLDAGFAELHRVLRPGGRLLVAWHGGTRPSRAARRLVLPSEILERIRTSIAARFGQADHHRLEHVELFVATRPTATADAS